MYQPPKRIPNAIAVLVLGIASIPASLFYGIFAIILGSIALALYHNGKRVYLTSPNLFQKSDVESMKAGKICAIIGIVLGIIIIFITLAIFVIGVSILTFLEVFLP